MSNEDPIVLYVIIKESLGMSSGKIAAQVGHAVQNLIVAYFKMQILLSLKKLEPLISERDHNNIKLTAEWIDNASRKVILKACDKDWDALKQEAGTNCFIIKDAGRTEVIPGSETTIVLWPMHKSNCSKTVRKLSVL
jgi:peptidyl-tRNA hydrolase